MSSFKKRVATKGTLPPPSGTRVSSYNSSVLLSTGIASVDDILGGGCPLGSILLIEEDKDTSYAKLLLKYWVAQGICCPEQRILLVSNGLDQTPEDILSKLPYSEDAVGQATDTLAGGGQTDDEDDSSAQQSMKIAFRYESMKKFETSVKSSNLNSETSFCSTYDLTKTMNIPRQSADRLQTVDVCPLERPYLETLTTVREALRLKPERSAMRIAIQSIGTPAWGDFNCKELFHFLLSLRSYMREYSSSAAAIVTLPGYLIRTLKGGSALLRQLEWLCDSVIELESFAGSPSLQSVFPAYSGLIHVHRLPTPNSLLPPSAKLSVLRGLAPGSNSTSSGAGGMDNNLGFKLKRRRGLIVETLHLDEGGGTSERRTAPAPSAVPPESTEPVDPEEQPDQATSAKSSVMKKKLEKRRIRFDDDPSENPNGILASTASKASAPPNGPGSGIQRDKPELYEF